jgi:rubrerythrin
MKLHTASEVISFAKELENRSARFYENLFRRYARDEDLFQSLAKENEKNIVQIETAYYSVITDAIEGCFAFDIDSDEYMLETELADNGSYFDALDKAVGIEEKMIKFYSDAAQQSKSMMADVPRNFVIVANKRNKRILKLKSLVEKTG